MDLRLVERAGRWLEHRAAEVEDVAGELEVEERRLELLELRRRRQHVVGEAGGLGHEHVDDERELERLDRFAHAAAVGHGVGRVARLDDQRPESVGVVGEDLLGHRVARDQPGEDALAGNRATRRPLRVELGGVGLHERHHRRGDVLPARVGEVPGEHPDQLLEVADQCRVPVHLDAEVLEHGDARRRRDAPRRRGARGPRRPRRWRSSSVTSIDLKRASTSSRPLACSVSQASACRPSWTTIATIAASSQRHGPGATWRWKSASSAVSVTRGSITTIDRSGSLAIALRVVRAWGMLWLSVRVLADEERHLALVELAAHGVAEHRAVDPHLAALLLGDGAGAVLAAEPLVERRAVRTAQVVGLAAAAVVQDLVAAVGVADRAEPLRRPRATAVSQSTSSKVPSGRRRSGLQARARRDRSGSGRGAAPSRTCSPATPGDPCRRGSARTCARRRRGGPRCRSCTRTGCTPSCARPAASGAGSAVRLLGDGHGMAPRVVLSVNSRPAWPTRSSRISSSAIRRSNGRLRLIRNVVTPARS